MPIIRLLDRDSFGTHAKLARISMKFKELILAMEDRSIPEPQEKRMNEIILGINEFEGPDHELIKVIKKAQTAILKTLEKELKIVSVGHYQNQWMILGMTAFGMPLGVAFGASLGNMAFLGIGLPIGMAIGIAVGASMDTKAKNEGRQLDWKAV